MGNRLFSLMIAQYSLLIIATVIGLNASAQELPGLSKKMDELFFKEDGNNRPGYSIAVIKDNEPIYQRSIGQINVKKQIPFTENSTFAIASCTKQFTGFSILLLEQEGKLNLNDDVRNYIPELPEFKETVKIKHLLSHTSGIRDHIVLLSWEKKQRVKYYTFKGTIQGIKKYSKLSFSPGENFAYSNTGFVLLAMIIERVSGQTAQAFMKERIFDPLGMNDTNLTFKRDYRNIGFSKPYNYDWESEKFKVLRLKEVNMIGAVGIYTTMNDYIKWDQNFTSKTVGDDALFDKFIQSDTLNNGLSINYNHGIKQRSVKGYHVVEHSGGWAFYNFQHTRIPELGISVIVASNNEFDYPIGMAEKYLKAILPNDRLVEAESCVVTDHGIWSQDYVSDNFITRTLEFNGETINISGPQLYGSKSYQLCKLPNGQIADSSGYEIQFTNEKERFLWAGGAYFNVPTEFHRIHVVPPNLASLAGEFENAELGKLRIKYDQETHRISIKSSFGKNPEIKEIVGDFVDLDLVEYDLLIKDENTLVIGNSYVFNLVFKRK
ncbi:MAG: serine hydrolase [Crocinitomicaceae bacterium]|nr:serine hydrolase [Crocinitomicaceae bacterium]